MGVRRIQLTLTFVARAMVCKKEKDEGNVGNRHDSGKESVRVYGDAGPSLLVLGRRRTLGGKWKMAARSFVPSSFFAPFVNGTTVVNGTTFRQSHG